MNTEWPHCDHSVDTPFTLYGDTHYVNHIVLTYSCHSVKMSTLYELAPSLCDNDIHTVHIVATVDTIHHSVFT